ncbi:MAG: M28 family peptidase [Dehalococcoidia bacterium]
MRRIKGRPSFLAWLAFAILLAGTACGGQDQPTAPSPTATPSPPIVTPSPPTATPSPTAAPGSVIADAVDGDDAFRHVLALAQEIGPRPAGEPGEGQAAQYIAQQLQSYGYQVEDQEFEFSQRRGETTLAVESPEALTLNPRLLVNSGEGQVMAPVMAAGLGRSQDFPAQGLDGGIALIERGELFFSDKAANAVAAGARAVIIYNNRPGPFRGALQAPSSVPVVGISNEEGQELLVLLEEGPLVATVSVRVEEVTATSRNVIGREDEGPCQVVVGGHYDSVPIAPGGNDNASGTAAVLEVARVAAAADIADGACFIAFGAEELGLLGSQHFVASLSQEEREQLRGMINLDVVGAGSRWTLVGSSSLVELALAGARDLDIAAERGNLPPGASSDHASFINAGIPAVFFTIIGGPPIHTPEDTAAVVQPRLLAQAAQMGLYVLRQLVMGER